MLIAFLAEGSTQDATHHDATQLLAVTLMVKNEAEALEKTLLPFVQAGIKNYFLYDTGSTDTTLADATEFFKKHALTKIYIRQEPFIDFATSRNHSLERAEQKFPHACFMLLPDAEWCLVNGKQLLEF